MSAYFEAKNELLWCRENTWARLAAGDLLKRLLRGVITSCRPRTNAANRTR
jgi:hypothetical protein